MAQTEHNNGKLPERAEPFWRDSVTVPGFSKLDEDLSVDVVIVGGGMTGLTSAYLLATEGFKVTVIEADKLVGGTTGHTTAKITAQHDLIYDEFLNHFGRSTARLYYEANTEALQFIKETVAKHAIDCDFSEEDAYLYATTDQYAEKLVKEVVAYKTIGIDGELLEQIPFKINVKKALVMKNQAQFHPVKYLSHLIQVIIEKGGLIFENTVAVNVETGERPTVLTRDGSRVSGDFVLACSHFPFYEGAGFYSGRLSAHRSYLLAVKAKEKFPGGMYLSSDEPSHSLRSTQLNGEEILLIGGENHKTGQDSDTMDCYESLKEFGEQVFDFDQVLYRWSAQDLETLDKIPYIGEITAGQRNILVATGFRKWGMTNGTAAALLFKDMIQGKKNPFEKLYTPSRFYANPSLKKFFKTNADVVKHLVKGKLELSERTADSLAKGEGGVISIDGHRKGAYKDEEGKIYIVDTTCTHLGCEVEWNSGDTSWDCPCHGSRFSYTGEVLEGPAEKPLKKYDYTMLDNFLSEDSGY